MPKKDGELIFKGELLLEHMIRFAQRNIGTNSDAYLSSSINADVSQDQQRFVLYPRVEEMNARDIVLAAVGKGAKKKIEKG